LKCKQNEKRVKVNEGYAIDVEEFMEGELVISFVTPWNYVLKVRTEIQSNWKKLNWTMAAVICMENMSFGVFCGMAGVLLGCAVQEKVWIKAHCQRQLTIKNISSNKCKRRWLVVVPKENCSILVETQIKAKWSHPKGTASSTQEHTEH
jgi:hypothetical protein